MLVSLTKFSQVELESSPLFIFITFPRTRFYVLHFLRNKQLSCGE